MLFFLFLQKRVCGFYRSLCWRLGLAPKSAEEREITATFHHRNIFKRNKLTRNFTSIGQIETNYDEVTDSFDSMDLKPELLRGM
ncbi:uncharacterized protein BO96DRAFT_137307 [Aspergillus niger CBS 101883]|uniref:uncharacterized protein n=1 Tax=Aspergillus lacticoffeatus (strain CBS 101883) TaxID=1450533 RepID=UPI000D7FE770|nr:uncharacterized protein BO96DRAFT_137307 [Aspergillus niger CBS 101883]PYH60307.1 hypothetical protein BO96DRAFT_137307 [Aspergillus niger CBS 101883]